jgi:phosphoribosylamine--glycine ligase
MNVLLLGSGGREHALAWKLAQSRLCDRLYAAPGNPGIAEHAQLVRLDAFDHAAVVAFCEAQRIGLVVIGPEAPLVDGLADSLRAAAFPVFGPSRAAAQLEGSKGFTKDLCARAGIPTAGYVRVTGEAAAMAALERFGVPVVIKADGLAAGKGVTVAMTRREADEAVRDIFAGRFGEGGAEAVIEEFLEGEEASLFALTDGSTIVPFGSAQDHKRVGDGDAGPNTGGMGAYTPLPWAPPELVPEVLRMVLQPTVDELARRGTPFAGLLYAGLALTSRGVRVVEFNARFGDPETQVLLPLLESSLGELLKAAADGTLDEVGPPTFREGAAVAVVLASAGYPESSRTGDVITGLDAVPDGVDVIHAGTALDGDQPVTAGGRVLAVTAVGGDVAGARARAYEGVAAVSFPGAQWRTDIAADADS